MSPKLSIIVPVFQVERYLRECIDSILKQSFTDFELLLVDDGSKDQSGKICDEYAAIDERIKVYHQENRGVGAARNLALEKAQGVWVTFIDADDLIAPDFLAALLRPLEAKPDLDFIHCGAMNFKNGKVDGVNQQYPLYVGEQPDVLLRWFRGIVCSKLFKSELIEQWSEEGPLRYDEILEVGEDMAFTLDYLIKVRRFAYIPETGYYYRRDNRGSITNTLKKKSYEADKQLFEHLYLAIRRFAMLHDLDIPQMHGRLYMLAETLPRMFDALYDQRVPRKQRLEIIIRDCKDSYLKMLPFHPDSKRWYSRNWAMYRRKWWLYDIEQQIWCVARAMKRNWQKVKHI